eukprot:gnl/Chilomastix_cuspidata/4271.p1 GENE.gnl/Chilomastix_cuspidata/4271~~gnl/Chilomastix_cuspidata/4271.p1  ORF type:complete len:1330 (-),score=323.68 gnl/Chilomastix_cuspidata/4271:85-4074(-)
MFITGESSLNISLPTFVPHYSSRWRRDSVIDLHNISPPAVCSTEMIIPKSSLAKATFHQDKSLFATMSPSSRSIHIIQEPIGPLRISDNPGNFQIFNTIHFPSSSFPGIYDVAWMKETLCVSVGHQIVLYDAPLAKPSAHAKGEAGDRQFTATLRESDAAQGHPLSLCGKLDIPSFLQTSDDFASRNVFRSLAVVSDTAADTHPSLVSIFGRKLVLWDSFTCTCKGSFEPSKSLPLDVSSAQGCSFFAVSSAAGTVRICDIRGPSAGGEILLDRRSAREASSPADAAAEFSCPTRLDLPYIHSAQISALSFNPFSPYLLMSASMDGALKTWDLRRPASPLHQFVVPGPVTSLCWSPTHSEFFAAGFGAAYPRVALGRVGVEPGFVWSFGSGPIVGLDDPGLERAPADADEPVAFSPTEPYPMTSGVPTRSFRPSVLERSSAPLLNSPVCSLSFSRCSLFSLTSVCASGLCRATAIRTGTREGFGFLREMASIASGRLSAHSIESSYSIERKAPRANKQKPPETASAVSRKEEKILALFFSRDGKGALKCILKNAERLIASGHVDEATALLLLSNAAPSLALALPQMAPYIPYSLLMRNLGVAPPPMVQAKKFLTKPSKRIRQDLSLLELHAALRQTLRGIYQRFHERMLRSKVHQKQVSAFLKDALSPTVKRKAPPFDDDSSSSDFLRKSEPKAVVSEKTTSEAIFVPGLNAEIGTDEFLWKCLVAFITADRAATKLLDETLRQFLLSTLNLHVIRHQSPLASAAFVLPANVSLPATYANSFQPILSLVLLPSVVSGGRALAPDLLQFVFSSIINIPSEKKLGEMILNFRKKNESDIQKAKKDAPEQPSGLLNSLFFTGKRDKDSTKPPINGGSARPPLPDKRPSHLAHAPAVSHAQHRSSRLTHVVATESASDEGSSSQQSFNSESSPSLKQGFSLEDAREGSEGPDASVNGGSALLSREFSDGFGVFSDSEDEPSKRVWWGVRELFKHASRGLLDMFSFNTVTLELADGANGALSASNKLFDLCEECSHWIQENCDFELKTPITAPVPSRSAGIKNHVQNLDLRRTGTRPRRHAQAHAGPPMKQPPPVTGSSELLRIFWLLQRRHNNTIDLHAQLSQLSKLYHLAGAEETSPHAFAGAFAKPQIKLSQAAFFCDILVLLKLKDFDRIQKVVLAHFDASLEARGVPASSGRGGCVIERPTPFEELVIFACKEFIWPLFLASITTHPGDTKDAFNRLALFFEYLKTVPFIRGVVGTSLQSLVGAALHSLFFQASSFLHKAPANIQRGDVELVLNSSLMVSLPSDCEGGELHESIIATKEGLQSLVSSLH